MVATVSKLVEETVGTPSSVQMEVHKSVINLIRVQVQGGSLNIDVKYSTHVK